MHLHAVDLIIIGSSIIFKHGGYQQCRITVVSPCAGYPYHFAKGYLDRSILKGFMASTLSSPRHGVCAYPTPTSGDKKHSTRKFGLKFRMAPETSRFRQMYPSKLDSLRPENATKGSRMFQASTVSTQRFRQRHKKALPSLDR